ncbi:MAG: hypothetical protein A2Y25_04345 [Candidatus Melainabacteria bacterium GWF2_37_15]|nr:MAG: hypothetical protein A2Y25_04345 [Candidatus Melainabacteria bacterium GWF2_37_15]
MVNFNKKVAILQSNYIPWKGYFDLINSVDEFVIYDDVQYTKNDWRNRNKIKTPNGVKWLSIPVETSGRLTSGRSIRETKIVDKDWNKKHWDTIILNYSKAEYFNDYKEIFEELYQNCTNEYLSEINYAFLTKINDILGIKTNITQSNQYDLSGGRIERLINICKSLNASEYISGPAARNYIDEDLFKQENIKLTWMDYSGYPEYNQLYPSFEHAVSIIDLIFNQGQNSTRFMKSFG